MTWPDEREMGIRRLQVALIQSLSYAEPGMSSLTDEYALRAFGGSSRRLAEGLYDTLVDLAGTNRKDDHR